VADILITGGTVVDGTGSQGYRAAVAVSGDQVRIVRGESLLPESKVQIDATGLVVAPGFIDLHSHSALMIQSDPQHLPKVSQGVTTEVVGIDGNSYAPFRTPQQLRDFVDLYAGLDGRPDLSYDWTTVASLLSRFDRTVSVNIATMIGNSALRVCAIGWDKVEANRSQIADMRAMLREGMQEGAFGLSTGLDYPPGCFADTEELIELADEAGRWGGFYHTHLRNTLGDRFLDPIQEAVEIGARGTLPLHLTHLYHRATAPGGTSRIFDLIDRARDRGVEVSFDTYPYEWSSTTALVRLPQWAREGGPARTVERLKRADTRNRIRQDIESWTDYPTWVRALDHVRLGNFTQPSLREFEGRILGELVRARAEDAVDVLCDLLVAENLGLNEVSPGPSGLTLGRFITHPDGMVGSDSIFLGDRPSPRTYGTFPRILGEMVREERRLSLPEAIRKMTSYPAQLLGILDRGILRDGLKADIVIFDPVTVGAVGTYDNPRQLCRGIEYVLVNGEVVMERGKHTGALAGRGLRRGR